MPSNGLISVSVRELARFSLARGDLSSGGGLAPTYAEGGHGHRLLQRSLPDGVESEVRLEDAWERGGIRLLVGGRADGVDRRGSTAVVHEIKTVLRPLVLIGRDDHPQHWAQLLLYAALLAAEEDLPRVETRLTYLHLETLEVRTFERTISREQLDDLLTRAVSTYLDWLHTVTDWRRERDRSLRNLGFVHPRPRPGQLDLSAAARRAVLRSGRLLSEAPTGIGKTAAALHGALSALPKSSSEQILYLTARNTGRAPVAETISALRESGARLKWLQLVARFRICPHPGSACDAGDCPLAAGHFDRLRGALGELFSAADSGPAPVERVAARHRVCPFLLSLEAVPWMDLVVGDVNYAFDPSVSPKVMRSPGAAARALLVDEAHNLVDRAREMLSVELDTARIRAARSESDGLGRELLRCLDALGGALARCCKEASEKKTRELDAVPAELLDAADRFCVAARSALWEHPTAGGCAAIGELRFRAMAFSNRARAATEGRYAALATSRGRNGALRLLCLDPSAEIDAALGRRPAIFFSGTLTPLAYHARTLGAGEGAELLSIPSPFPARNLCIAVADRTPVSYRARRRSLIEVADLIRALIAARPGNYLTFLPSHDYLRMLFDGFRSSHPEVRCVAQDREMDERARHDFLTELGDERPLLGFAVMGGVFGEGIDLVGDRLSGAAVVSVGLPAVGPERERIRAHFARSEGDGFAFAYAYPGIGRVMQAAGRVIRSATDRGALLLIDERFGRPDFAGLLPEHWSHREPVKGPEQLKELLQGFWEHDDLTDACGAEGRLSRDSGRRSRR
ncbi:MAG: ATP-dependent DNA helicase [Polyangia bacterium]